MKHGFASIVPTFIILVFVVAILVGFITARS